MSRPRADHMNTITRVTVETRNGTFFVLDPIGQSFTTHAIDGVGRCSLEEAVKVLRLITGAKEKT